MSFSFSINDDDIFEDDENITLTINPSSTPDNVNGGQAIVTIVDDDRKWFTEYTLLNSATNKMQRI